MADQAITDIIQGVRTRLGRPDPTKVRILDIILTLFQVIGNYRTDMKLVDQNWFVKYKDFPAPPNTNDFPLVIGDFSRALTVEWRNPGKPHDIGVEVQIINFQDGGVVPVNRERMIDVGNSSIDASEVAHAIAFTGMPPSLKVRITPTAERNQYTYRVYYAPINESITDISGSLNFPPEFYNLLIVATAYALLANCGYSQDQWTQYSAGLGKNLRDAEANFKWYIGQNKQQSVRSSRGYAPPGSGRRGSW